MICPFKLNSVTLNAQTHCLCEGLGCAWWDKVKRQCCIKTLSELKISGGIKTFPLPKEGYSEY